MFTTLLLPLFTMDFGFAAAAARRGAEMMQSAASQSTENWGPARVVDPVLSSTRDHGEIAPEVDADAPTILGWQYKPRHLLPRWGRHSDDLAAVALAETLEFAVLVRSDGACVSCGKTKDVTLVRHHPGGCGAYEWTHGIDIDWRWKCCGKHEKFGHGRRCAPVGSHETGCVEAPLCSKCFRCPCVQMIKRRKQQEHDM